MPFCESVEASEELIIEWLSSACHHSESVNSASTHN